MSSLLDRSSGIGHPPVGTEVPPSPLVAACLAAGRAAATGLLPVLAPVVLAWVLGAGGQASWSQTVRFSLGLWLLAHHAGLVISGGHVGLVPIGLIAAPLLACWFAARRLARSLDDKAERIEAGATRAAPAALSWRVLLVFVGAYCVLACLASLVASMPGMRPVSGQALVGAAVISLVGGGLGAAAYRWSGARRGLRAVLRRTPGSLRPWLRPAAGALAVWVGGGAALITALLLVHAQGIMSLHRALDAGVFGGAVLTLAQAMLLPNLAIWAAAVMAGPGISLGTGATVTVAAGTLGPLPAVPVLAALPAPGLMPALATSVLAVPLLAGVTAGVLVLRRPDRSTTLRLTDVAGTAALSGVGAAVLAWLSGGPAGPGRLADVGPDALLTGAAFAAEVAVGAASVVLVTAAVPAVLARMRPPPRDR